MDKSQKGLKKHSSQCQFDSTRVSISSFADSGKLRSGHYSKLSTKQSTAQTSKPLTIMTSAVASLSGKKKSQPVEQPHDNEKPRLTKLSELYYSTAHLKEFLASKTASNGAPGPIVKDDYIANRKYHFKSVKNPESAMRHLKQTQQAYSQTKVQVGGTRKFRNTPFHTQQSTLFKVTTGTGA